MFSRLSTVATTGMRTIGFWTVVGPWCPSHRCRNLRWPPGDEVGAELVTVEKENVRTTYGVSTVPARLLTDWIAHVPRGGGQVPRVHLFPHRDHPDLPVSTDHVRRVFMRVARRAGVRVSHVHPHQARRGIILALAGPDPTHDAPHCGMNRLLAWMREPAHGPCVPWGTASSRWRGSWVIGIPR